MAAKNPKGLQRTLGFRYSFLIYEIELSSSSTNLKPVP